MTGFTEEQLPDQLQTVSVTTDGSGVQVGPVIPVGHVRKFTRIHVKGLVGSNEVIGLYQGDASDLVETLIDQFSIADGNPDHIESSNELKSPLILIRPDETRPDLDPVDEVNNIVTIRRDSGLDTVVSVTFYDDRA